MCGLVSISLVAHNLAYNENKLDKNSSYLSRDMLNFDFLEKGLGIASLSYFVYDLPRKMFLTSYSIS